MSENYTPQIIPGGYILFAIQLQKCAICNQSMVFEPGQRNYNRPVFPPYIEMNFNSQVKRARIAVASEKVNPDGDAFCKDCEKAGKVSFVCCVCKDEQDVQELHESVGSCSPSHLCKTCYATIPAKQWDELNNDLEEEHQYDNY